MTLLTMPARVAEPLKLVRRQAQPKAVMVGRLTVTAVAAYLIAKVVPISGSPPTLAPLTALLVLQVTLYRTMRSAVQRIGSVVGGVIIAVVLAKAVGFTWWGLGLAIGAALVLGLALRLGDQLLEVPISAMLILSLPSDFNATDRIVETLIGAGTGLLAGLILSPLRVQPAEEAIEDVTHRLAGVLDRMSGGLRRSGPSPDEAADWLRRARQLGREIGRVRRALEDAEDSIRLNPRAMGLTHAGIALGSGLESIEHFQVNLRGLANAVADGTRGTEPAYGRGGGEHVAAVLGDLADAVRAFGRVVASDVAGDPGTAENDLRRCLAGAERHRDRVAEIVVRLPANDPAEWALRGALLAHLDRLIDQLRVEHRARERERWPRRRPPRRARRRRDPSAQNRPGAENRPHGAVRPHAEYRVRGENRPHERHRPWGENGPHEESPAERANRRWGEERRSPRHRRGAA